MRTLFKIARLAGASFETFSTPARPAAPEFGYDMPEPATRGIGFVLWIRAPGRRFKYFYPRFYLYGSRPVFELG